jgi:hypothetical protein
VSIISILISVSNNRQFASRQFINKQIDVITALVESLHNDRFEISFVPRAGDGFSKKMHATIFELPYIPNQQNIMGSLDETSVYYESNCNQLLNIKHFIDNPFLPKSIADCLFQFYSVRLNEIAGNMLPDPQIIVLKSNHFEKGIFHEFQRTAPGIFRQSEAAALNTWKTLTVAASDLQTAILKYLSENKVVDINIRKDFKHIYLS